MKEHPIIFSAEMVKAILEDRKTQTRRVIKPQPMPYPACFSSYKLLDDVIRWTPKNNSGKIGIFSPSFYKCPYGTPGDRLWVKETIELDSEDVFYRADMESIDLESLTEEQCNFFIKKVDNQGYGTLPSIHMPRWASRITLEITDIRVERLHLITPADVEAEGIDISIDGISTGNHFRSDAISLFRELWDSINAGRGFGWEENPWVWVITFRRLDGSATT